MPGSGIVSVANAQKVDRKETVDKTADETWCYFGTTGGQTPVDEQAIHVSRFNTLTGQFGAVQRAAGTESPSFLAVHPTENFLYATREVAQVGGVAAFRIDRVTGQLQPLNDQPAVGSGTCHVSLDATGKVLLLANYGSGSFASLPVADDGTLNPAACIIQNHGQGPLPRQTTPHAHSFNVDPTNRFALACDLGTDQVLVFQLDVSNAQLTPVDPPFAMVAAGSGPRHLAFHPDGKFVYVVNELSNTVTAFAWDANIGQLREVQTITTLPANWNGESYTAEIRVHSGGELLYASNRGHNSIAVFRIDRASGCLENIGWTATLGDWPRHFEMDPTGHWLVVANELSNDVFVFQIDRQTGDLRPAGGRIELPAPSCVRFVR